MRLDVRMLGGFGLVIGGTLAVLSEYSPVSIGRASDCSIPIKDRYLSRRHAEIISVNGSWLLKDLGSVNGTYLNGARVERDTPLRAGDRIRLGDSQKITAIALAAHTAYLLRHCWKAQITVSFPRLRPHASRARTCGCAPSRAWASRYARPAGRHLCRGPRRPQGAGARSDPLAVTKRLSATSSSGLLRRYP